MRKSPDLRQIFDYVSSKSVSLSSETDALNSLEAVFREWFNFVFLLFFFFFKRMGLGSSKLILLLKFIK